MTPGPPHRSYGQPLRRHRRRRRRLIVLQARRPLLAARNLPTALRWAASIQPTTATAGRRRPFRRAPCSGLVALPQDVLWQILLTLPAKELCRLRAVCRSWRSITSYPAFIAAHKARHRETLLIGGKPKCGGVEVLLIDLQCNVLKRIHCEGLGMVVRTNLDLVCVPKRVDSGCAGVINPATGVTHALPRKLAAESKSHGKPLRKYAAMFVLGRVDTEVYKVLRILTDDRRHVQLFEVLTLDSRGPTPWRAVQGISGRVEYGPTDRMVIDGVVYLFLADRCGVEPDCIARFNLNTEKWMPSLGGPIISHPDLDDIHAKPHPILGIHGSVMQQYSLAEANGSLVVARFTFQEYRVKVEDFLLDLWYLVDSENCRWERKYRIDLNLGVPGEFCSMAYLCSVLEDGMFLLCVYISALDSDELYLKEALVRYNPETTTLDSTFTDVTKVNHFGVYTGSLLSVRNG